MINFKINGVDTPIPSCWEDLTFGQYLQVIDAEGDTTKIISCFTGMDIELLKKAEISGLSTLLQTLTFIGHQPTFTRTGKIGPYEVPADVTIESLGQFEDLRALMKNWPEGQITNKDSKNIAILFAKAAAIYCQKLRDGQYDYTKAIEMLPFELYDYPCPEVIGTGAFFLAMPRNMLLSTMGNSPTASHPQKNKKQASQTSGKRSGSKRR